MKLSWELEVLSKAVLYPNLTVAATQVALSQPQLSRILKRVEDSLGCSLLDRDSKRKVSWKPEAFSLVEKFVKLSRQWESELDRVACRSERIRRLRIGCLEGISEAVADFVGRLVEWDPLLQEIDLDVVDLGDLERAFVAKEYDLIFTSRSPGKKKYAHSLVLGKQRFENVRGSSEWWVATPFELAHGKRRPPAEKKLITKSLWMKRLCAERLKASASIPVRVKKFSAARSASDSEGARVYLLASDDLPSAFWKGLREKVC